MCPCPTKTEDIQEGLHCMLDISSHNKGTRPGLVATPARKQTMRNRL